MLNVEYVNIDTIKPYSGNAKLHPQEQIDQIKKSIQEFGMNDPIAVWKDEIVEGHGRVEALKELGIKEVPIIRLDHLNDEQRKAYTLVHNKLTMNSDFDIGILNEELGLIQNIDMSDYGFNFVLNEPQIEPIKINERERTNEAYNLSLFDINNCDGKYQIPIIENNHYIPKDLIGFNYAKTSEIKNVGIHFYLDDYQFERSK